MLSHKEVIAPLRYDRVGIENESRGCDSRGNVDVMRALRSFSGARSKNNLRIGRLRDAIGKSVERSCEFRVESSLAACLANRIGVKCSKKSNIIFEYDCGLKHSF